MEDRLDSINWTIGWTGILENSLPMSWNLFLALLPLGLSCVLFHQPRSPIVRWGIWILVSVMLLPHLPRVLKIGAYWLRYYGTVPTIGLVSGLLIGLVLGYQSGTLAPIRIVCWWLGCGIFILFLPNAAYVLTDVIHFVLDVRKGYPMGTIVLLLLPQYLLFISTGFQAYVAALMNLGYFLEKQGYNRWIFPLELGLHGLTAIGVYLGRFTRLNSWDIFTMPGKFFGVLLSTTGSVKAWLVTFILFSIFACLYWLCKRINLGLLAQKQAFREVI